MFEKIFGYFKKKKEEPTKTDLVVEQEEPKEVDVEISYVGNITKVDIKEDCHITDYVPTMRKYGQEWIEDKIPNSVLLEGLNIKKKTIYLFEKDNRRYACYSNSDVIVVNEMITLDNNHIDDRRIEIRKKDDSYTIHNLKHDEVRSTYFVKFYNSNNPEQAFFQLDKDVALDIAKDMLDSLNKISGVSTIIDLDKISQVLGLPKKDSNPQIIAPVILKSENEEVKIKQK